MSSSFVAVGEIRTHPISMLSLPWRSLVEKYGTGCRWNSVISLFLVCNSVSVGVPASPPVCTSVFLPIWMSACSFACLFECLPACWCAYLNVCLPVCLPVWMSACLFDCDFACLSKCLSSCLFVKNVCLTFCLSARLSNQYCCVYASLSYYLPDSRFVYLPACFLKIRNISCPTKPGVPWLNAVIMCHVWGKFMPCCSWTYVRSINVLVIQQD